MTNYDKEIDILIKSIKNHNQILMSESARLRTNDILKAFDKKNYDSWCLSAVGDSLVKLKLFTEQNFNFVESMGVVSVTRYIFELSVWINLFKLDPRFGLVYYSQLLDTTHKYWKDLKEQMKREISLLQKFEKKESEAMSELMEKVKNKTDPEQQKEIALKGRISVSDSIDKQAVRLFSIYTEQAKTNGYGFQAHLVEQKTLPKIKQSIIDIENEKKAFNAFISQDVKELIPERWQWRQMSQKVGVADEYDFIYTFSSKLLHATPSSITTNQKNLEVSEIVMFLKYINIKIKDIIELSGEYPKSAA